MSRGGTPQDDRDTRPSEGDSQRTITPRGHLVPAWLAVNSVSVLGDGIWTVALAWAAVHLVSPSRAGIILGAAAVPRGLLILVGGAVADRVRTRRVLALVAGGRFCVMAGTLLVLSLSGDSFWLLLGAALAVGALDAFYLPAGMRVPYEITTPDHLPRYQGAMEATTQVATVCGMAVGGVLVTPIGFGGATAINSWTFVFVVLFFVALYRPVTTRVVSNVQVGLLKSVASGVQAVRTDRFAKTLIVVLSGSNLFIGPVLGIGLALKVSASRSGPIELGVFEALVAAGAIAGALAAGRYRGRNEALFGVVALIAQGASIISLIAGNSYAAGTACVVLGVTMGAAGTLLSTFFVRSVPSERVGIIVAVQGLADELLTLPLMAAFGALAGGAGVWCPFVVFGLAMLVYMLCKVPAVLRLQSSVQCGNGASGVEVL